MAKGPPSFPFYPGDFLGGTLHLDAEAIGCYLLLLCFQWLHKTVPNECAKMARICRMEPEEFAKVWPEIEDKFVVSPSGDLINERLEVARNKKQNVSEARAEAGRLGGLSRGKKDGEAIAKQLNKQNPSKGKEKREKRNTKKKESAKRPAKHVEICEQLDRVADPALRDCLAEWIEYKRCRGEPYQPTGLRAMVSATLSEASEHGVAAVVADRRFSMLNNYAGAGYQLRDKPSGNGAKSDRVRDLLKGGKR